MNNSQLRITNVFLSGLIFLSLVLLSVPNVFAHVVVRPAEVGIGARTNFTVSVPTEEDVPTIQVRLVIPEGVQSVRPNTMPGWNISLTKSGDGESAVVTEITWSGGSIPAEQRAEFVFSAQAPAQETSLNWKAYQTYANGMVVAWATDPKSIGDSHDENAPKPFSVTKVVNDLAASPAAVSGNGNIKSGDSLSLPMILSIAAIVLSGTSLYLQMKSKRK